eukprot:TRINITY_DN7018_c0_g1_i1.p1 TRINITY_DN7018_c0_g1~~TRINITY_DN7018_c0_g1_i1.p1  ORF type:complete len:516 (+),score=69.23 TRINITY_DN7018_c0_g1_i1:76-1623(+)
MAKDGDEVHNSHSVNGASQAKHNDDSGYFKGPGTLFEDDGGMATYSMGGASTPAVGTTKSFWISMGFAVVFGLVLTFPAIAFLFPAQKFPVKIFGFDERTKASQWGLMGGEWWWVGLSAGAGLLVGILRVVLRLPHKLPTLMEEIKAMHVSYKTALQILLVCCISLMSGASLGPEAGLGTMAGGFADLLAVIFSLPKDIANSNTLSAMGAAFGGLLNSPLLGVILVVELARVKIGHGRVLKTVYTTLLAGSLSFAIFYPIVGKGFLGIYTLPSFTFQTWHLAAAVPLGILSAMISLVNILVQAIVKKVCHKLFDSFHPYSTILLPTIGGAAFGAIGVILPLTLSSGSEQISAALDYGVELGPWVLMLSVALKAVTLAIATSTGFIGGPFFPILYMGGVSGIVVHLFFPQIPLAVTFGSMFCSVMGGMVPAPYTFIFLALLTMSSNIIDSSIIAVSMMTAFFCLHGTGLVQFLVRRAGGQKADNAYNEESQSSENVAEAGDDTEPRDGDDERAPLV